MPAQTVKQPIDPVLTTIVQGYTNAEFVGHMLFPFVDVAAASGQLIEFDKSQWTLFKTERARGANIKRINSGFSTQSYTCKGNDLEGVVTEEDLRDIGITAPNVQLGIETSEDTMAHILLKLEVDHAALARNPANYAATNKIALSGSSKWTDPASTPLKDLKAGSKVIRSSTAKKANTLLLSPVAFDALTSHAVVLERLKITADGQAVTTDMLATLLDVTTVVVGEALTFNEGTGLTQDVWGNDAVLAYVPPASEQRKRTPSFGYTYRLKGNPAMRKPYYEPNIKSWVYQGNYERAPYVTAKDAGYLFQNVA